MFPNLTLRSQAVPVLTGVLGPLEYLSHRQLKKLVPIGPLRGIMVSFKGASSTLPPQETDSTAKTVSDRSWSAPNRIQLFKTRRGTPGPTALEKDEHVQLFDSALER